MFFKRTTIIPEKPVVAIVHQLTTEEIAQQTILDITPLGAGLDIKLYNKEDTLMVEKLKAYCAELEAQKTKLLAADHTAEIEDKVVAYREALIKEAEDNRIKDVAKIDSDIACINKIIENEIALAAVVTEDAAVTE